MNQSDFRRIKKTHFKGAQVFSVYPQQQLLRVNCSAMWRSWISSLYFSVLFFTLFRADVDRISVSLIRLRLTLSSQGCCPVSRHARRRPHTQLSKPGASTGVTLSPEPYSDFTSFPSVPSCSRIPCCS